MNGMKQCFVVALVVVFIRFAEGHLVYEATEDGIDHSENYVLEVDNDYMDNIKKSENSLLKDVLDVVQQRCFKHANVLRGIVCYETSKYQELQTSDLFRLNSCFGQPFTGSKHYKKPNVLRGLSVGLTLEICSGYTAHENDDFDEQWKLDLIKMAMETYDLQEAGLDPNDRGGLKKLEKMELDSTRRMHLASSLISYASILTQLRKQKKAFEWILPASERLKQILFAIFGSQVPRCKRYTKVDKEWEQLRKPFHLATIPADEYEPRAIYLTCDEAGVIAAMQEAYADNSRIVVRSGGHSWEGWSTYAPKNDTRKTILVDMYHMNDVTLSTYADNVVLSLESGAKNFDIHQSLFGFSEGKALLSLPDPVKKKYGLKEKGQTRADRLFVVPTGTCGDVGAIGWTLGGGFGSYRRLMGLGSDLLVSARVAYFGPTGNAVIQQVSENTPYTKDLFWALRGAGMGSFGIVTQISLRVAKFPADGITTYEMNFDYTQAEKLLTFMNEADPALSMYLNLYTNDVDHLRLRVVQFGTANAATKAKLTELGLDKAPSKMKHYEADDYMNFAMSSSNCGENVGACIVEARTCPHMRKESRIDKLGSFAYSVKEVIAALDVARNFTSDDIASLYIASWGGKINEPKRESTAFPHRDAMFLMIMYNIPFLPAFANTVKGEGSDNIRSKDFNPAKLMAPMNEAVKKIDAVLSKVRKHPNFLDREMLLRPDKTEWLKIYYGKNVKRLRNIKAYYDPRDIFNFPMSIPLPDKKDGKKPPTDKPSDTSKKIVNENEAFYNATTHCLARRLQKHKKEKITDAICTEKPNIFTAATCKTDATDAQLTEPTALKKIRFGDGKPSSDTKCNAIKQQFPDKSTREVIETLLDAPISDDIKIRLEQAAVFLAWFLYGTAPIKPATPPANPSSSSDASKDGKSGNDVQVTAVSDNSGSQTQPPAAPSDRGVKLEPSTKADKKSQPASVSDKNDSTAGQDAGGSTKGQPKTDSNPATKDPKMKQTWLNWLTLGKIDWVA